VLWEDFNAQRVLLSWTLWGTLQALVPLERKGCWKGELVIGGDVAFAAGDGASHI
jgi:hypothetical protein